MLVINLKNLSISIIVGNIMDCATQMRSRKRMWENVRNMESILPLDYKKGPGRPKKLRRRELDEVPNPTKLKGKNNIVPM